MMNPHQLTAYLNKLSLPAGLSITEESLIQIHRAQHRTIPFENFNIQMGLPVSVEFEDIAEKLIFSQRGGYCFELNELMFHALQSFGFSVQRQLARVHLGEEPTGRSHQVSLVHLDGETWVVDTGFGSSTPRSPLPLQMNKELTTDLQTFRFIRDEQFGVMLQTREENDVKSDWKNLYSFDMSYVCSADIKVSNFFVSHSPDSFFVGNRIAALPTDQGIVTLLNHTVTINDNGTTKQIILDENEDYVVALSTYFSIELNQPISSFKAITSLKPTILAD